MNIESTITLTFGDCAESHVGMEIIGMKDEIGFTLEDLKDTYNKLNELDIYSEIYLIEYEEEKAYILIIKNGVDFILDKFSEMGYKYNDLLEEQMGLEKILDKKALMRGRVVNKKARWNLLFDNYDSEPDYVNGKSRIVAYNHVPVTSELKSILPKIVNHSNNLKCEGNYYYNKETSYIGFHGDTERRKVIGIRIGERMPLWFRWFHKSKPVTDKYKFNLDGGDIYIMSEKAVGNDWKKSSKFTLRHAAGNYKILKKITDNF